MRTKALPLAALALSIAAMPSMAVDKLSEKEAAEIAKDAYVYGYPLVTMEFTRRVTTNVPSPRIHGPMGQFVNAADLSDARRSRT